MYDQKRGKIGVTIVVSLALVTAGVIGAFHFVSEGDVDEGNDSEIAGATDNPNESADGGDEGHESVDPATDGGNDTGDDAPTGADSETERQSTDSEGADAEAGGSESIADGAADESPNEREGSTEADGTDSTDTASEPYRTDGGRNETGSDAGTNATGDAGEQSNDDGEQADDDAPDDVEYPGGMQIELVDLPPQLDTEGRTLFGVAVRSETPESGEAVLRIDGEVVDSATYMTEASDAFDYAEGTVQLFAVDPDVEAGETYPVVIETDHGDRTFDIRAEEPLAP